jgi:hypothetical protein
MRLGVVVAIAVGAVGAGFAARSDDDDPVIPTSPPARPVIAFNRWQEDWSVLADPALRTEPLDDLKYIPLGNDPKTYLSLGLNLRERYEQTDANGFGIRGTPAANYVISRLETHADLHLGPEVQIFAQLESAFAPGKERLTPVDENRLDLEQAFAAYVVPLGDDTFKFRLGRQEMGFDLQRFVAVRDGPNIRQAFDAAWADYETGLWRLISFYSQPVQDRNLRAFDDYSNGHLTFSGFRLERKDVGPGQLSAFYARYTQDGAHFLTAHGNEERDIFDIRYAGSLEGWDWDLEAMGQTGEIGTQSIHAWAFGNLAGYSWHGAFWAPRLGLQFDGASGDSNPHDHVLETFNPLFPNGYYVTLSGYTGYVNFIHLKPSVTLHPLPSLTILAAVGLQWRQTTADAVYTQPNIAVAGTAGKPGSYTGTYGQFRLDWRATSHVSTAVEAVHFAIGDAIRRAGGHDADYLGVEIKYGW